MTKELLQERFKVRHIRDLSFSGLRVFDAMRLRVVHLEPSNTIEEAIRQLIRHKASAVLISDARITPLGVVSKTELISAYYGGLDLITKLQDIMSSPVLCVAFEDKLDDALTLMQENCIHRLYVLDEIDRKVIGTVSYQDIVGLLYRYCHVCDYGQQNVSEEDGAAIKRLKVGEVMTCSVKTMDQQVSLSMILEELAMSRIGAVLLLGEDEQAAGVISKTDLCLAYGRGVRIESSGTSIMSKRVYSCTEDQSLEGAVRTMILGDLSRLFVYKEDPSQITGILSLTDIPRARSGSCQVCGPDQLTR